MKYIVLQIPLTSTWLKKVENSSNKFSIIQLNRIDYILTISSGFGIYLT